MKANKNDNEIKYDIINKIYMNYAILLKCYKSNLKRL